MDKNNQSAYSDKIHYPREVKKNNCCHMMNYHLLEILENRKIWNTHTVETLLKNGCSKDICLFEGKQLLWLSVHKPLLKRIYPKWKESAYLKEIISFWSIPLLKRKEEKTFLTELPSFHPRLWVYQAPKPLQYFSKPTIKRDTPTLEMEAILTVTGCMAREETSSRSPLKKSVMLF